MNKKGQALVEFVIILPILIYILLAIIDIATIFYTSNKLENKLNDVVDMYESDENTSDIKDNVTKDIKGAKLEINDKGKYTEIELSKDVDVITPGLNLIIKNPYKVTARRVVKQ